MGYPKSINGVTLSDDLLIEILTRLPLKSLFRSKCVSKSWHSLISDDYVRNKLPLIVSGVLNQSNSTLKSEPKYVSTSNANFQELNLSFLPFQSNSALIDCCNGLLLFYSALTTSFHVCNPTTKRWVSLPKPSKATQLSILAFDPCHSQHFKVVNFVGWHAQGADLELFDSALGKYYWVEREVHWGIDTDALSATMRYLGGVLYITAHPKQIVAVDLESMDCRLIELPEPTRDECCVGKLGGWLYYTVNDGNQLRVWMLKERGEWVLKHCVSIKMGQFRVLALHPEREMVYLQGVRGKLVAYDVCEERVEEVWELGKKGYLVQVCVFPLTRYVEDCLHG